MQAIGNAVTPPPTADGILTHTQLIGQLRDGLVGHLNVLAGLWSRGGIGMQVDVHGVFSAIDIATSSPMTSLARNNDPILDPYAIIRDPTIGTARKSRVGCVHRDRRRVGGHSPPYGLIVNTT